MTVRDFQLFWAHTLWDSPGLTPHQGVAQLPLLPGDLPCNSAHGLGTSGQQGQSDCGEG